MRTNDFMDVPSASIPHAPGALPFAGHAHRLLRDPFAFLTGLPSAPLVNVRLGSAMAIVVRDPQLADHVLRKDQIFDKGGPLFEMMRKTFANDIVACPYGQHRRLRRLLQPAFHPARMPGYSDVMYREASKLTCDWSDGQIIHIPDVFQRFTARVAVGTLFGNIFDDRDTSIMLEDLNVLVGNVYRYMFLPDWVSRLPTRLNRRYRKARTRAHATVRRLIRERRQGFKDEGDFLSILMSSRDGEDRLSEDEIVGHVVSFFLGSIETVAATLSWAFVLLHQHPDIEAALHGEIDALATPSFSDFKKLPLSRSIIDETLRLYPPGWILTRTATTDCRLGDYAIAAGTPIILSPFLMHRRGDLYTDAASFNPRRISAQAVPGSFIPFGRGPRRCMGDVFAMHEATAALVTIARRWRLTPLSDANPARGIVLNPLPVTMRADAR